MRVSKELSGGGRESSQNAAWGLLRDQERRKQQRQSQSKPWPSTSDFAPTLSKQQGGAVGDCIPGSTRPGQSAQGGTVQGARSKVLVDGGLITARGACGKTKLLSCFVSFVQACFPFQFLLT